MKRTLTVMSSIVGATIIGLAGCSAPGGGGEVGGGDSASGVPEDARTIKPGKAFKVDGFTYSSSWSLGPDERGQVTVTGLKATNKGDDTDNAEFKIELWSDGSSLGSAECTSEDIEAGATAKVDCVSEDVFDGYDTITISED